MAPSLILPHLCLFTLLPCDPSPCLCRVSQILSIRSFLCTETISWTTWVWRLASSRRSSLTLPAFTGFRFEARSPQARSRLECARLSGPEGYLSTTCPCQSCVLMTVEQKTPTRL